MPRISASQMRLIEGGAARPDRVRAGRSAQRVGLGFERHLEAQHDAYRAGELARLERNELPTVPAGGGQPGQKFGMRRITGPARWDFEGVLGPVSPWPGRHLVVEAKHSSVKPKKAAAKLPIRPKGGLSRAQLDALVALHAEWRSVVALVWECVDRVGWMPGSKLEAFRVQLMRGGPESIEAGWFTWLGAADLDYLNPLLRHMRVGLG